MITKMKYSLTTIKTSLEKFLQDPFFLRRWESPHFSYRRSEDQLSVKIAGYTNTRGKAYPYGGDASMLVEDTYTAITPYMLSRADREKSAVSLSPASPTKMALISDALSGRSYPRSLADSLYEFIRNCTQDLMQEGVVFYEILSERDDAGEVESFSLESIEPAYLFRLFRSYYQVIPWWVAKAARTKVQITRIPYEKILRIEFPKAYGGKRKLRAIIKRLWQLSKELIPKFQMDAMSKNEGIGFDFTQFDQMRYLEVAELTRDLGWSQRRLSTGYTTEYYSMVRFLRKKKLEATLRSEILNGLNRSLNGSCLNLNSQIVVEKIFSVADVEKQEEALGKENGTFQDISNALDL
jgi:hypothetical protein